MLRVETKEMKISDGLKRKLDMICKFASAKAKYINGSIRNIKGTNVAYVEPHKLIVGSNIYLVFEESNKVFVNDLSNQISMTDLESFIKNS